MSYKQDIVKLREQGKTYDEIEQELDCSKGTISYHCQQEGLEDIGKKQHKLEDEKINEIQNLRKEGKTYDEIRKIVDVSESAAKKYGSDVECKKEVQTSSKPKRTREEFLETNKYLGRVAEEEIASDFVKLGHTVLEPRGNERYDFVVEAFGDFYRIQCKHGNTKNGGIEFNCRWQTKMPNETRVYSYSQEDIDFFAVYASEKKQTYIVSVEEAPNTVCKLRVNPTKNRQSKNIRWAENYKIEDSIFS